MTLIMTAMTQIWILMMIGSKEEMDETNCVQHLKKKKKKKDEDCIFIYW